MVGSGFVEVVDDGGGEEVEVVDGGVEVLEVDVFAGTEVVTVTVVLLELADVFPLEQAPRAIPATVSNPTVRSVLTTLPLPRTGAKAVHLARQPLLSSLFRRHEVTGTPRNGAGDAPGRPHRGLAAGVGRSLRRWTIGEENGVKRVRA